MGKSFHKKKFNNRMYNYYNTVHSKESRDSVKRKVKEKGYLFRSVKRGHLYDNYTLKLR